MKHLCKKYNIDIYKSSLLDFYFRDMKAGVLDIETTGLNPSLNKFILGGLYDTSEGSLHQFFAESRSEEEEALTGFYRELKAFDMVVTYNGRHFDMPFIQKRLLKYGIREPFPPVYNLDLYLVLNGHSPLKKFVPNLKQKTVESYMGLWQSRSDEISGAQSVELYAAYEKERDPALERSILLHNSDDILQLARLIRVVTKSDFHRAMFHLGFPAGPLTVTKILLEKDFLVVSGIQRAADMEYMSFSLEGQPVEARFERRSRSFTIRLPVIRNRGMVIADLEALAMDTSAFEKYPAFASGFLVLEGQEGRNYMEINHFIKAFTENFLERII